MADGAEKAQLMRDEIESRYLEDRRQIGRDLQDQTERVNQIVSTLSQRLDELDDIYTDMHERLYEVDKTRKNNLVVYGLQV